MADHQDILNAIFLAVDELNLLLPPDRRLARSDATPITGGEAALDSLGLLNLIMAAEARINEHCSPGIDLAERFLADPSGTPPRTLGELASLVAALQVG